MLLITSTNSAKSKHLGVVFVNVLVLLGAIYWLLLFFMGDMLILDRVPGR